MNDKGWVHNERVYFPVVHHKGRMDHPVHPVVVYQASVSKFTKHCKALRDQVAEN